MDTFVKILLWIWQLPQNLVGLCLFAFHKVFCKHKETFSVYRDKYGCVCIAKHVNNCGVSLGSYIFFDFDIYSYLSRNDFHHEIGHRKQSNMLGPFYLIIIGLPSAIGNLLHRIKRNGKPLFDYYKQPWEKWADKLGGVERYGSQ